MDDSKRHYSDDESCNSMYFSFDSTMTAATAANIHDKTIEPTEECIISIDELVVDVARIQNLELNRIHSNQNTIMKCRNEQEAIAARTIKRNVFIENKVLSSTPNRMMANVRMQRGSLNDLETQFSNEKTLSEKSNFFEENKENNPVMSSHHLPLQNIECLTMVTNSLSSKSQVPDEVDKIRNCEEKRDSEMAGSFIENKLLSPVSEELENGFSQNNILLSSSKLALGTNVDMHYPTNRTSFDKEKKALNDREKITLESCNSDSPEEKEPSADTEKLDKPHKKINNELNEEKSITATEENNKENMTSKNGAKSKCSTNILINDQPINTEEMNDIDNPKPSTSVAAQKRLKRQSSAYNNAIRRMSIVVKTTLNSPARKVARKSLACALNNNQNKQRRSLLPLPQFRPSLMPPKPSDNKTNLQSVNNSNENIVNKRKTLTCERNVPPPNEEKICPICSRKFRVRSLYEAHRRSHEDKSLIIRSSENMCISLSNMEKQCKFCDKKFAFLKAISNHLIENCTKIPPGEKKKLILAQQQQCTVPKASLPKVPCHRSRENLAHQHFESEASENEDNSTMRPPQTAKPTTARGKKKLAHSGVYQTPNKTISCNLCKLIFNSVLAYTEHNLSMHSLNASNQLQRSIAVMTNKDNTVNDSTQTSPQGDESDTAKVVPK